MASSVGVFLVIFRLWHAVSLGRVYRSCLGPYPKYISPSLAPEWIGVRVKKRSTQAQTDLAPETRFKVLLMPVSIGFFGACLGRFCLEVCLSELELRIWYECSKGTFDVTCRSDGPEWLLEPPM